MTTQADPTDVVVVGGGLAGLCAAAWLARAGRRVQVLDAGPRPGGRAVTDVTDGVHFNLGPHALYIGGPADRGLADLGIARRGGKPTPGGLVVRDGVAYPMPAGPWSMLTTGALTLGQRLTLGRALTTLMTARAGRLHDVPISEYLAGLAPDPEVRAVLAATVHVATYASSPELAAGVAVSQVQAAVRRGVRYLDGGWQTLVDQLLALLRDAGVPVRGYVSCVIACPYDGSTAPEKVLEVSQQLLDMGCYEISLGDTTGVGTPASVNRLLDSLLLQIPASKLAVHFHDTYGQALANIYASLEVGVQIFHSSVSGLGGCPYAKGATGNVATEDVLYLLHGLGIETGIDLDQVVDAGQFITQQLGRKGSSRAGNAIAAKRLG